MEVWLNRNQVRTLAAVPMLETVFFWKIWVQARFRFQAASSPLCFALVKLGCPRPGAGKMGGKGTVLVAKPKPEIL